jgi:hypothetical protein
VIRLSAAKAVGIDILEARAAPPRFLEMDRPFFDGGGVRLQTTKPWTARRTWLGAGGPSRRVDAELISAIPAKVRPLRRFSPPAVDASSASRRGIVQPPRTQRTRPGCCDIRGRAHVVVDLPSQRAKPRSWLFSIAANEARSSPGSAGSRRALALRAACPQGPL